MTQPVPRTLVRVALVLPLALCLVDAATGAQDRLRTMPGYEQHQKVAREIPGSVRGGSLAVSWKDAATFEYAREGKLYRYNVTTRTATGPTLK